MPTPLDRFFVDAADDAETAVHRVRVALAILAWSRLALFKGGEMFSGEPKHVITTVVLVLGVLLSALLLRGLRRAEDKRPWLTLSPLLDAAYVLGVVMPGVVWPRASYVGVLLQPDFGLWLLIATGAGFRLSRSAVWSGAAGRAVLSR